MGWGGERNQWVREYHTMVYFLQFAFAGRKTTLKCSRVSSAQAHPTAFSASHGALTTSGLWISYGQAKKTQNCNIYFKAHADLLPTPPQTPHTRWRQKWTEQKLALFEAFILQVSQKRKLSRDLTLRLESPQVYLLSPRGRLSLKKGRKRRDSLNLAFTSSCWQPGVGWAECPQFWVDQDGEWYSLETGEEATAVWSWGDTSILEKREELSRVLGSLKKSTSFQGRNSAEPLLYKVFLIRATQKSGKTLNRYKTPRQSKYESEWEWWRQKI